MTDWRDLAECAKPAYDAETWFPDQTDQATTALAKSICAQCPVESACLEDALRRGDDHGIRGGYTEDERRAMQGKRPRHPKASNTQPRDYCQRGHPMTPDNVLTYGPKRQCRACTEWRRHRKRRAADTAGTQRVSRSNTGTIEGHKTAPVGSGGLTAKTVKGS